MKLLVIFNSFSGKKHKKAQIEYIKDELSKKFQPVDFFSSFEKGSIEKKIKEEGSFYDAIAILGGDGTAHEAINSIMSLEKKPKVLLIPLGTCNDFSYNLLGRKYKKAINNINLNNIVKIDLVKINDCYMTYAMALGAATKISYVAKSKIKGIFGKFSYFLYAIRMLVGKLEKVKINDKKYFMIVLTKSKSLGGINLKNKLYLNDGLFNYYVINNKPRVFGFFSFFNFLWANNRKSQYLNEKKIILDEDANINIDGEFAFKAKEINVSVEKEAIEVFISSKNKTRYVK